MVPRGIMDVQGNYKPYDAYASGSPFAPPDFDGVEARYNQSTGRYTAHPSFHDSLRTRGTVDRSADIMKLGITNRRMDGTETGYDFNIDENDLAPRETRSVRTDSMVGAEDNDDMLDIITTGRQDENHDALKSDRQNLNQRNGYVNPVENTNRKRNHVKQSGFDQYTTAQIAERYNDMKYTDYNHLPVASGYKSTDYEYGYSFLPPEKWFPENQPVHPPKCVQGCRNIVAPVMTSGAPLDMKEWYDSTRITPPQKINIQYIQEKGDARE